MKKIFALILILALTFVLASCGEKEKEEEQLILAFNTNGLTNETMSFMVDVMQAYCDENNIKFLTAQDNDDFATTQTNLENFVAGGAKGIIFRNADPTASENMVGELEGKGVAIVSYDEISQNASYSFTCSFYDLGYAIGKMAAEWANEHIEGEAINGLMSVEVNAAAVARSDGIQDGFNQNVKNGRTVRQPISGHDFEGTWENMLIGTPELNICTSLADACVVGVAATWYADLMGKGMDISHYGVFSTDATDIALDLITQAKNGKGIYRGTIDLGLKDAVPLGMIKCCHAAALGQKAEGYDKVNYYKINLVMEDNVEEFCKKYGITFNS